jgi:hypothetical protein
MALDVAPTPDARSNRGRLKARAAQDAGTTASSVGFELTTLTECNPETVVLTGGQL